MKTIFLTAVFTASLISASALAAQADVSAQWQERRLLEPSAAQRTAEQSGKVIIYDRMDEALVDKALDSQFERIENMMFIHIQRPQPVGEAMEDDDC